MSYILKYKYKMRLEISTVHVGICILLNLTLCFDKILKKFSIPPPKQCYQDAQNFVLNIHILIQNSV